MDLTHIYKGTEIKKVEKSYWGSIKIFYIIPGVGEYFYTLRDAKQYIDNFLTKK